MSEQTPVDNVEDPTPGTPPVVTDAIDAPEEAADPLAALESAPLTQAEQNDALAAELVLGVLEDSDAQAARARQGSDPAFAALVRDWQERMAGMVTDMTPIMAPARARQRVRETLGLVAAPLSVDPTETTPWYRGPVGLILLVLILGGAAYWFL